MEKLSARREIWLRSIELDNLAAAINRQRKRGHVTVVAQVEQLFHIAERLKTLHSKVVNLDRERIHLKR